MSETAQTFRTVLEATGGRNVGVVVPDEVVAALGRGKRVPVVVTVDGGHSYRTTLGSMGGRSLVSFNAATRAATGRGAGDEVEIRLVVDDAPRTVEVPPDLQAALESRAGAAAAWAALSPSKQQAHVVSVSSAKAEDTRARRVATVVEGLGDA